MEDKMKENLINALIMQGEQNNWIDCSISVCNQTVKHQAPGGNGTEPPARGFFGEMGVIWKLPLHWTGNTLQ